MDQKSFFNELILLCQMKRVFRQFHLLLLFLRLIVIIVLYPFYYDLNTMTLSLWS